MNQSFKLMPRYHWNWVPGVWNDLLFLGRVFWVHRTDLWIQSSLEDELGSVQEWGAFSNQTNSLSDSLGNFRAGHLTPSGCFCHLLADGWWCKIKNSPAREIIEKNKGRGRSPHVPCLSLLGGVLQKYHVWWAECLQESQITAVRMDYKSQVKPSQFYKWYISFITDPLLLLSHTRIYLYLSFVPGHRGCCAALIFLSAASLASPIFLPSCIKKLQILKIF